MNIKTLIILSLITLIFSGCVMPEATLRATSEKKSCLKSCAIQNNNCRRSIRFYGTHDLVVASMACSSSLKSCTEGCNSDFYHNEGKYNKENIESLKRKEENLKLRNEGLERYKKISGGKSFKAWDKEKISNVYKKMSFQRLIDTMTTGHKYKNKGRFLTENVIELPFKKSVRLVKEESILFNNAMNPKKEHLSDPGVRFDRWCDANKGHQVHNNLNNKFTKVITPKNRVRPKHGYLLDSHVCVEPNGESKNYAFINYRVFGHNMDDIEYFIFYTDEEISSLIKNH